MFIVENNTIQSSQPVNFKDVINLVFKFGNSLQFQFDDRFILTANDIENNLYAFTNEGCLRFKNVDYGELKAGTNNINITIKRNGVLIASGTIVVQYEGNGNSGVGGECQQPQGVLFNDLPRFATSMYISDPLATQQIIDFSGACQNFRNLQTIPFFNTDNGLSFKNMFYYCLVLKTIPTLNTSKGIYFDSMFSNSGIQEIPALDTSNGTSFSSMFSVCNLLKAIPALNTSKGTSFSSMFQGCSLLKTIPELDTSNGTTFNSMFYQCNLLETIPALNASKGTNFNSMFYQCKNLLNFGGLLGVKKSFSLTNSTLLTHDSLINTLNGLADLTGSSSQTLTLGTTNLGKLTAEQKAIATNKNWVLA